jgi:hypothetical protein
MGLLDFLISLFSGGSGIQCPSCGTQGARKTNDGLVLCKNPQCPYFGRVGKLRQAGTIVPTGGNFHARNPISIRYRNFAGQDRTFSAELSTLIRKNNHLVAEVAPTGGTVTISRDRIQNLAEVEAVMPQRVAPGQDWPTPRERQILGYHKKHGTTSQRYEQVRAKYPDW